jgi:hypothetical protein
MNKRLIHRKRLNKITAVEFHENDVSIIQEETLVVLDKEEILELARLIENERRDQNFYKKGD